MPKYSIAPNYDGYPVAPYPEREWPVFSDGHTLMAWFERQGKKLEHGADFRTSLIYMRRYLRSNRHIDFDERCWTKFLMLKNKNNNSPWYFSSFSHACTPWSSRENDLLFLTLLEKNVFHREDRKNRRNWFGKPTVVKIPPKKFVSLAPTRKVVGVATFKPVTVKPDEMYPVADDLTLPDPKPQRKTPKGKTPLLKTRTLSLSGRPILDKTAKGIPSLRDRINPANGEGLVAKVVAWIFERGDLENDLPEDWARLVSVVTMWSLDRFQYWRTLEKEFSGNVSVVCTSTYKILDHANKERFARDAVSHMQSRAWGQSFLFYLKTKYGMWSESEWQPRVFDVRSKRSTLVGGLKMVLEDSDWLMGVRTAHPRFKTIISSLPAYAAECMLTDNLQYPNEWNFDGAWQLFPQLPLEVREFSVRLFQDNDWKMWDLNSDLYGPNEDDLPGAVVRFVKHLLPEYMNIWDHSEALVANMAQAMQYLDAGLTPLSEEKVYLPTEFNF